MTQYLHGQGNSGPASECWAIGDRVMYAVRHSYYFGQTGAVRRAPRDPHASETGCVWVHWDDGDRGWIDPNTLDAARK
jgi:hypothetical protein